MYARLCVYTCVYVCVYAHMRDVYVCMRMYVCDLHVYLTLSINVYNNRQMSIDVPYVRSNGLWLLAGMIPLKVGDVRKSSNHKGCRATYRLDGRLDGKSIAVAHL